MSDMTINDNDLVNNPTARVPVCLCLDASSSMSGLPIEELNAGVRLFFEAVKADEIAQHSVEVAIVTFGGGVRRIVDFGPIHRQEPPTLTADGGTPMGQGVHESLEMLERRKRHYAGAGVDYYQPWLVLMTDGQPTDSIDFAASRSAELAEKRKLTIFPIGIGPTADLAVLGRFSPKRPAVRLQGLNFKDFFEWLSKSVTRVSQSIPGQSVPLAPVDPWAQV